jgi:hypothetical protein
MPGEEIPMSSKDKNRVGRVAGSGHDFGEIIPNHAILLAAVSFVQKRS